MAEMARKGPEIAVPSGSAGESNAPGEDGTSAGEGGQAPRANAGEGGGGRSSAPGDAVGSAARPTASDGGRASGASGADGNGANGGTDGTGASSGAPSTTPSEPYTVVTCGELGDGDGCTLGGAGDDVVLRGFVLTPGVAYAGGALRFGTDGVIQCAGCDCDDTNARVVTCPGAVVSPGFVNPHDHVAYDAVGPGPATAERYDHRHDWRLGLRGHAALEYEGGASGVERAAQELRMLLGGATSVAGAAGHQGLLRNPDMPELGEGLPTAPADSQAFPLDDADGRLVESGCGYGKHHAEAEDVERSGSFLAHLGEGVDAAAENELTCALAPDFGLIESTTSLVHAVAASAEQAAELGRRSALVVWSPRSNVSLYGNTAPIPLLLRSGVDVALGTDWLLSGSMNLLRELRCARELSATYFDHAFDDHALFLMATLSAARAVGASSALGRLAPGYLADVSVIGQRGQEPYTAAVAAEPGDFELVLRGGRPLYGRRALVEALSPEPCEALEVCGSEQAVCAADSGYALADLQAAADATYPLFACGEPPNEPTCVPSRPGEYDGVPRDDDPDGDGVPTAVDLCPRMFAPPRPFASLVQANADGDGEGDACDPCPLDADPSCHSVFLGDRDGDGVPDGLDDCPDASDPEQPDTDGDGRGDACDFCARANPGKMACPLAIAAIRDPSAPEHPPRHALVEVAASVVTALRPDSGSSRGFYVQAGDAPFSGLFVYTGSRSPGVVPGDLVSFRGRYDRYYEADQLVLVESLAREPGVGEVSPLRVSATDIGDDGALARGYDSMLVCIADASVAATNPDAPSDYDETGLDGALRLDDQLWPELDNVFAPGEPFSAVTGVLGRTFDHQKLWPRAESDLVR